MEAVSWVQRWNRSRGSHFISSHLRGALRDLRGGGEGFNVWGVFVLFCSVVIYTATLGLRFISKRRQLNF